MGELHVRRRRHGLGTGYGGGSKAGVGDKGAKQSPCDHAISLWVVSHDSRLKHRGEQDCWTTFLDDCLSISDSAISHKSRDTLGCDHSANCMMRLLIVQIDHLSWNSRTSLDNLAYLRLLPDSGDSICA